MALLLLMGEIWSLSFKPAVTAASGESRFLPAVGVCMVWSGEILLDALVRQWALVT